MLLIILPKAAAPLGVLWGSIPRMHFHITLLGNLICKGPFLGLVRVLCLIYSLNLSLFLNKLPETLTSSVLTNTILYPLRSCFATIEESLPFKWSLQSTMISLVVIFMFLVN